MLPSLFSFASSMSSLLPYHRPSLCSSLSRLLLLCLVLLTWYTPSFHIVVFLSLSSLPPFPYLIAFFSFPLPSYMSYSSYASLFHSSSIFILIVFILSSPIILFLYFYCSLTLVYLLVYNLTFIVSCSFSALLPLSLLAFSPFPMLPFLFSCLLV